MNTEAKIAAARQAAGKPHEADAYAAAQRALTADLEQMMNNGMDEDEATEILRSVHGVSVNEHGTWIIDEA